MLDAKIGKGGASPRSGGRDVRPPTNGTSAAANRVNKSRWIPPSSLKRDPNYGEEKYDQIFRRVRGILNKLSPEKFDKLSLELLNVGIDSQVVLKGIILLIFEKALDEVKYSSLYAQLCQRLCDDAPNFEPPDSNITTFRRLLLNKCQDEFENRSRASEAYDKRDGPLSEEEAEQYHVAKWKMLGNIKFIGELGKLQMLHEGILHKCIKQLLEKKKNTNVLDMAEDLECLCQIMRTVGPRLDTSRAKAWMDQYFERIRHFASNEELPPRIRFMLQDVVELRAKKWKPRQHATHIGPKTINEIRQHAAAELGLLNPPQQNNRMSNMIGNRAMNGGLAQNMKGGMGDLFSAPANSMNHMIGTGPGVISLEANSMPYNGMGRNRNHQNQGYQNNYHNRRQQEGGSPRGQRQNNPQNNQQTGTPYQQNQHKKETAGASGSRDLPPRFQRMAVQQQTPTVPPPVTTSSATNGIATPPLLTREEVSLRPVKNFNFKPNTPKALPKSALAPTNSQGWALRPSNQDPSAQVKPIMTIKQEPLPIKQIVVQEKNKSNNKKAQLTKHEVIKIANQIGSECLNKDDATDAIVKIKNANVPRKMLPLIISNLMINTLDKTDEERENVMKLIYGLKDDGMLSTDHFIEALKAVLGELPELEKELPLVKSYIARFAAMAVVRGLASLSELADMLENGAHYPLFMLCLQQMYKIKDKDWLLETFNNSKIDLQMMLPELDQKRERLLETLEDRGLTFLFPLMKVQSELLKQIQLDPSANTLFKWIKERVDNNLQKDPKFISILTSSIVKYIAEETTLADKSGHTQAPEKPAVEKEKELLEKLKVVLQMFLRDHIQLNIVALYAVQVYCYQNNFPKGMLLRFFMNFYDMEIVEEDAFLRWKEEVNDNYPGKGKALFQVNQWLTWLEQAEEESEEDSDDD